MEGDRTEVGESDMKRRKRGKQTLKRKMLSILLLCAMSCILAVVIVSYMTIRMIQNDSIQESMQIYLEQITREIDSDYYDMIGIVNQMSPNGLIGSVTESYLSVEDNYDRYFEQKSLREELIKLGYVNTKLLGIAYYDPKEQKELIGNFNVRVLDPSHHSGHACILSGKQGDAGTIRDAESFLWKQTGTGYLCRNRAGYERFGSA